MYLRAADSEAALSNSEVCSLLLVRNGVDHDARVLRAARVAESTLARRALIVGVATAASPAGDATVEGVSVLRLPVARPSAVKLLPGAKHLTAVKRLPGIKRVAERLERAHPRIARRSTNSGGVASTNTDPAGASRETTIPARTETLTRSLPLTPAAHARRILSGLSYTLRAVVLTRRLRVELVHANDWNTMWAGILIKYLGGARLVYDSHELWADRNGRWEWRLWLLACEALFLRVADEVLTSSPGYADALAARYHTARPTVVRNIPDSESAAVLPSGIFTRSGGPAPPSSADQPRSASRPCTHAQGGIGLRGNGGQSAIPLIVYIGGVMPGRGLEQMIEALALIPTACLRAIGPGASRYRASLLAQAQIAGVAERLELRSPVPPAEIGSALAGATAGLCLIQPICRSYELCLPNKLFEYAAAGVPVLASDLPVIGELVRDGGFGVLAPPEDPHAIAASLERLLEPEAWMLAAQCAQAFAAANSWASEAQVLQDAYRRSGR